MTIVGKFTRVSKTDYRDGNVLVALLGNVYPDDLTEQEIDHIKGFYNMPDSEHTIFPVWPEKVEARYPAAKNNYINGFILLRRADNE